MLSSNFPKAAAARVASKNKNTMASSGSTTTVESFVYSKTTRTTEKANSSPTVTPKKLSVDFDNYSTMSTVPCPYTPNHYAVFECDKPSGASKVIDLSKAPSPVSSIESSSVKIDAGLISSETKLCDMKYSQLKRDQPHVFLPSTPSGKSPAKKKADTCPSDEKLFGRKAKIIQMEKHGEKENESLATVAPYSVYSNSETSVKETSKKLLYRADKQTQLDVFHAYQERLELAKDVPVFKAKPKKVLQTVIAADNENNITFRAPSPKLKTNTRKKDDVEYYTKKEGEWRLPKSAYKSGHAFMSAARIKRAAISSARTSTAVGKINRATEKEGWDVFGDIMVDIRGGNFDAEKAKRYVDSFGIAN